MTHYERFLALHHRDRAFVIPNPWDAGSARLLESMGFEALATTSSGFAGTLGRMDGGITRDEALRHAEALVDASSIPVSADLENGFGHTPEEVAETVRLASLTGLAGCSIEDFGGDERGIYEPTLALERIQAALEAASASGGLVITARAENHLHGVDDLGDTIARLQSFEGAGAPVLYAPGLVEAGEIEQVVTAVSAPVNVLGVPGAPSVPKLSALGVKRVSVGSGLAWAAFGAAQRAAQELLDTGTYGFWREAVSGAVRQRAFGND